jgi:hypothetical protein
MREKPEAKNSAAAKELDKAQSQFEAFEQNIKDLTMDAMNKAPNMEMEEQTKLSQAELEKKKRVYLKPVRSFGPGVNPKTGQMEKFNEKFRAEYEFAKEYVEFIAENIEIIGETIKMSLKKFPGTNLDHWEIPVNTPIWAPRMVAERLTECGYHVLKMEDKTIGSDALGTYHGTMVAKNTVQRMNARPVSSRKSLFMGAANF